MQTLTVTAARAQLGHWLARAVRGEEIGVVVGAQIVALRPVPIQAADYLETEYGLTAAEAERAIATMKAETRRAKNAGTLLTLDELAATLPHASSRRRKKRQPRAGRVLPGAARARRAGRQCAAHSGASRGDERDC